MVRSRSVMPQTAREKSGRQAPASTSSLRQPAVRMSAPERKPGGGRLVGFQSRMRVAYLAGVAVFLWSVAQFYHRDTGFSSLISIGDLLNDSKVTALRQ